MKRWPISILLPFVLAVLAIKCTAPLSSGASSPSYVRLLNADPFTGSPIIRLSSDGNILVLCTATVPGDSVTSIELTKSDVNGNVLWTKHFGGKDNYQAGDVYPLSSGTIVVAGVHTLPDQHGTFVCAMLDANGSTLKYNEYSNLPALAVTTLRQAPSGDIIIGGQNQDPLNSNTNSELAFLHLSSTGDSLGISLLATGTTSAIQYKITEMSNIVGNSMMGFGTYDGSSNTPAMKAFYLWQSPDSSSYVPADTANFYKVHRFRCICRTGSSTFMIGGDSSDLPYSNHNDGIPWIGEINPPASGVSQSVVPNGIRAVPVGYTGSITSIIQTADGGLAATGFSATQAGDTSIVVFRFNANGSDVWPYKTIGFNGGDVANTILELSNGDLIIGGVTTSFGSRASGARQIFLLHLNADGTPAS